jgi:hypothetical protein
VMTQTFLPTFKSSKGPLKIARSFLHSRMRRQFEWFDWSARGIAHYAQGRASSASASGEKL